MDAGPRGKDLNLPDPTGRGIAIARGRHVAPQLTSNLRNCAKAKHDISVAPKP